MDDDDDLIGSFEDDPDLAALREGKLPDRTAFFRPVGITFLAELFGTEPRRISKKLAQCPIVGYGKPGRNGKPPLYDFKEACGYLVPPKLDNLRDWLKTQSPTSLPPYINKAFWEAERIRDQVMQRRRHLWEDEDVLQVLGETAMAIKQTAQLWIENLPGKANLTTEQYSALQDNVRDLLDDIHERLIEMPKVKQTESLAAKVELDDE